MLDFGLVKRVAARSSDTAATMPPVPAGTPAYMPPELAMAGHPVDNRADIYSIGCVAYWPLTGQQVFERETSMPTILAHVRSQPELPSLRSPHPIPPALDSVIMACLAKDLASRPPTADDLSERLAASIDGEPWSAAHARRWWQERGGGPKATQAVDRGDAFETLIPGRASRLRTARS